MAAKLLLLISILSVVQTSVLAQEENPEIRRLLGRYLSKKRFLTTEQVAYWLETGDPAAYQKFTAGQRVVRKGGIVAITGGGIAALGGVITSVEGIGTLVSLGAHEPTLTGPVLMLVGSAVAVPGFAIMIVGKSKKNRAVKQYNETIRRRNQRAYFYQNFAPGRVALGIRF